MNLRFLAFFALFLLANLCAFLAREWGREPNRYVRIGRLTAQTP